MGIFNRNAEARSRYLAGLEAENREYRATITRLIEAVNAANAHRFDFDPSFDPEATDRVGGPDDFYHGCTHVTRRFRAALKG